MRRRDFIRSSIGAAFAARFGFPTEAHAVLEEAAGDGTVADEARQPAPTAKEMQQTNDWFAKAFSGSPEALPFSFTYDAKASSRFLDIRNHTVTNTDGEDGRRQRTMAWTDPQTGLEIRCVAVTYRDFPVVEWTLYFKNTSRQRTPVLEAVLGLDTHLRIQPKEDAVLHYSRGDYESPRSYQPFSEVLAPNGKRVFAASGGRPTSFAFPYYNLQLPEGGLIAVIGWPGEWKTSFERSESDLHLAAGQELTHLCLEPGEEIRSPLIALLFWQSADWLRAQNLWRRWMLAHNLPRPGGKLLPPIFSYCDGGFYPGLKVNEAGEKHAFDVLTRQQVKLDYWWLDAGWYPCGNHWWNTGTWEPDLSRFPGGLKAIHDYVHRRGTRLIVWFEPERVTEGTWLAKNHPEWLLHCSAPVQELGASGSLLNLGNPEVQAWLHDHIGGLISGQGIDLYRQDFNINPLQFWRQNDAPDRQGITENLYVQGYLAYLDGLRRRFPDMPMDTSAAGGRRLDLETLRRAVPLGRSDYPAAKGTLEAAAGNQGQTYGLSLWVPYYGQGTHLQVENAEYHARSAMCPSFAIAVDLRKDSTQKIDWELYRRLTGEWRHISKQMMLGDYYPLTEYTLQEDQWIAWQFHSPEAGTGAIQAFRRSRSEQASQSFHLHGLAAAALYRVTSIDTGRSSTARGRDLMERGLPIEIPAKPGSAVLVYETITGKGADPTRAQNGRGGGPRG